VFAVKPDSRMMTEEKVQLTVAEVRKPGVGSASWA